MVCVSTVQTILIYTIEEAKIIKILTDLFAHLLGGHLHSMEQKGPFFLQEHLNIEYIF